MISHERVSDQIISNLAAHVVTHCWSDTDTMDEAKHLAEQAIHTVVNYLEKPALSPECVREIARMHAVYGRINNGPTLESVIESAINLALAEATKPGKE